MSNLEQLIETTRILSLNLERMANDEVRFCTDLQMRFEQMSWEFHRYENELREIKNYV